MKKHILPVACMAALLMAGGVISSCSDIDPVHSLELSRVLSPTNLSVRVRNSVNLELSWDAMDKATSYTVEVYEGATAEGTPVFTEEGYKHRRRKRLYYTRRIDTRYSIRSSNETWKRYTRYRQLQDSYRYRRYASYR